MRGSGVAAYHTQRRQEGNPHWKDMAQHTWYKYAGAAEPAQEKIQSSKKKSVVGVERLHALHMQCAHAHGWLGQPVRPMLTPAAGEAQRGRWWCDCKPQRHTTTAGWRVNHVSGRQLIQDRYQWHRQGLCQTNGTSYITTHTNRPSPSAHHITTPPASAGAPLHDRLPKTPSLQR